MKQLYKIEIDFLTELVINYNKRHKQFARISGNDLVQKLIDISWRDKFVKQ